MKNIVILGSTGVLGTNLANFLNSKNIRISFIACHSNFKKLHKQKLKLNCNNAVVLNNNIHTKYYSIKFGDKYLIDFIKNNKIDFFYVLNIGAKSLEYIDLINRNQKNCCIAIANKEVLVAGGSLLIQKIYKNSNSILPLDSEHFSLIDFLPVRNTLNKSINKIYLTATGGPFYFNSNFDINKTTLSMATKHPIWKMGYKNSIDSSNLVNKILECFELSALYNISLDKINITISPKAFVHSLVLHNDDRITINCFKNDMMIPLTSPFTQIKKSKNIDLINYLSDKNMFNFSKFDNKKFQILKYYKKIFKFTHSQQILFMLLNSNAVERFISGSLKYQQIIPFIFDNLTNLNSNKDFKSIYDIVKYVNIVTNKIKKINV